MVTANEARLLREIERLRYDKERITMTLPRAKALLDGMEGIACACVGGALCCKYRVRVAQQTQAVGGRLAWAMGEMLRWRVMTDVMLDWRLGKVVCWAIGVHLGVVEWNSSIHDLTAHDIEHLNLLLSKLVETGAIEQSDMVVPGMTVYRLKQS